MKKITLVFKEIADRLTWCNDLSQRDITLCYESHNLVLLTVNYLSLNIFDLITHVTA